MDNIGDLLYVLIGVGWLLYSFFKKKKPKPQPQPYNTEEQNTYEEEEVEEEVEEIYEEDDQVYEQEQISREEVLRKIFEAAETEEPVVVKAEPVVQYTAPPEPTPKPYIAPAVPKPVEIKADKSEESYAYEQEHESTSPEEEGDKIEFDLKEAVINSIILKRPEY